MRRKVARLAIFLSLWLLLVWSVSFAQGLKKAVWAGQFYEADPLRLSRLVDYYLEEAGNREAGGELVGLIAPHAGYIYSGKVAGSAYRVARNKKVEVVVIIGPSHYFGFQGCSIYLKGGFETPLGVAEIDERLARELARQSGFSFVAEAFEKEHSVEVQVPFIQKVFPGAKIVPVVMGSQDESTIRRLAEAMARVLPARDALVVASTDLSHFYPRSKAAEVDHRTITQISQMDIKGLLRRVERGENIMCGGGPVLSLLLYAQKIGPAMVEVLSYSDSAASGGPEDRVVGYLAAAVTIEKPVEKLELSATDRQELLQLARKAIAVFLETGELVSCDSNNQKLFQPAGVFVTLKKGNVLRGCVGFDEPVWPLWQAVVRAAVLAATQDPRFLPVRKSELKELEIEISVLGPLQPVKDISEIKIGQHGLVIKSGEKSGLLLPQVATEFGWDRLTFLRELCRKAGLPDTAWRARGVLFKFESDVFRE